VLHGVSLRVESGEAVALLGRNGAGKTTLIRTIVGFTPPARRRRGSGSRRASRSRARRRHEPTKEGRSQGASAHDVRVGDLDDEPWLQPLHPAFGDAF
jgi:ABC-type glutathione transport system ATPase component